MKKILISVWLESKNITCKYYPTCSEYTKQAIEKYGALKGTAFRNMENTKM